MKRTTNDGIKTTSACCIEIPLFLIVYSENDERLLVHLYVPFGFSVFNAIMVLYKFYMLLGCLISTT